MPAVIDLKNQIFGRLTVIERTDNISGFAGWKCLCSCGNETSASSRSLISGKVKSCGCYRVEMGENKLIDLSGTRFGRLTVIERTEQTGVHATWRCLCDCGKETSVVGNNLKNGHTTSCGCYHSEVISEMSKTHGESDLPLYYTWLNIKQRCTDSNHPSFDNYGGRGISLAPEWMDSPKAFSDYIGPKPSPDHSVDRENNNGNYEPGNVRWATRLEQNRNRRDNVHVQYQGNTYVLSELCDMLSISYGVMYYRLYTLNETVEQIVERDRLRNEE